MAPFLEVITNCYKRPVMLAKNQQSLKAQTCDDWIQTLLVDDVGRGTDWVVERIGLYGPHLRGSYIWVLDDDDLCIRPTFVAELKQIVADSAPDVIMLRMDHGERGILPPGYLWGQAPVKGKIGCSAFVVRREIWQQHAMAWLPGQDCSDYNFISSIFEAAPKIYWHDVIASRVQRISRGQPEGALI